jgi:hypothetical protein
MFDGKNLREERFSELLIRFKEEDERRSRGSVLYPTYFKHKPRLHYDMSRMLEAIPRANRSEPNWLHDAVLRGDLSTIHARTKDPSANIDINLNDTLEYAILDSFNFTNCSLLVLTVIIVGLIDTLLCIWQPLGDICL